MIRKVHLYLGLFLAPWVVMYAMSTAAMNHHLSRGAPQWEKELEQPYMRDFAPGFTQQQQARQILSDLQLEGAFTSSVANGRLTINRQDPVTPRRIVYADQRVTVEKQKFAMPAFLERMHRKRGYQHAYAIDDAWAVTVDVAILAILFWSLSGLWLWWEMKKTRLWGAACLGLGCGLFALFLATI